MDKYLLFDKQMVCNVVEKDKVHPKLFKNWRKKRFNHQPARREKHRVEYNGRPQIEEDGESVPHISVRSESKRKHQSGKLQDLLDSLDIDFELSEVTGVERRPKQEALDGKTETEAGGENKVDAKDTTDGVEDAVKKEKKTKKAPVAAAAAEEATPDAVAPKKKKKTKV